jgi:hypothetical protein
MSEWNTATHNFIQWKGTPREPRGKAVSVEKTDWHKDPRTWELVRMIIECRDALPAITMVSARLHNVPLDLDKRIEQLLKPWESDGPNAI